MWFGIGSTLLDVFQGFTLGRNQAIFGSTRADRYADQRLPYVALRNRRGLPTRLKQAPLPAVAYYTCVNLQTS